MVKLIKGQPWYLCPVCNQKMFPVRDGAVCKGVIIPCRRCGEAREMIINYREIKTGVSTTKSG
nr:MAG TPA: zinc-ribbon domain protein [Caudoviricetes sp.]